MEIIVAQNAGFCMGVKRAVELALAVSQPRGRVFTYGQLIHNPQTVELLAKRGVKQINDLSDLPADCSDATLIIRAHGISPGERAAIKARGIKMVDATCPRVGRVQAIVRKHSRLGYAIVIVGDSEHPEVRAIGGYAEAPLFTVATLAEAKDLPFLQKVCVVAQTTCSEIDYQAITEAIKQSFPEVVIFDTICDSTEKRQKEISKMAHSVDAVIVVGGKNSANTRRLAKIASAVGTRTFHIESEEELAALPPMQGYRVGISAGASTPNWVLDRVVQRLREANSSSSLKMLPSRLGALLVKSDILSAIGALSLCLVSAKIQAKPIDISGVSAAVLFLFAMHTLHRSIGGDFYGGSSFRMAAYFGREKFFFLLGVFPLLASLVLVYSDEAFWFLVILAIAGIFYNTPSPISHVLRKITVGKNVAVALAWTSATVVLPVGGDFAFTAASLWAIIVIFSLVLCRSLLSDTGEMQEDGFAGRKTLPTVWGKKTTLTVVRGVLAGTTILITFLAFAEPLRALLAVPFFYLWIYASLYASRSPNVSGVALDGLLAVSYLLAGLYLVISEVY
ncbi:MAG: 4-hydroxy-3-methylbut-2-enyl diphosphate reductase [Deltaproteobacteria bacterium]|nr:4-hydroxy-3-methylbut-2-enyl diphosphate reductase [Deltaproteobacteria bacterium]